MKNITKLFFLGLLVNLTSLSWCQDNVEIDSIRADFKAWQPIIEKEADTAKVYYSYCWGDQYQNSDWLTEVVDNDSLFLDTSVMVLAEDSLGYFVQEESTSPPGDWFLVTDSYYHENGQLYFVFWQLNTFQAEEPVSVEKRFYYNPNGELIRELESVYKMNTKVKVDVSYFKPEIDFEPNFFDLEIYEIWKRQ